MRTIRLWLPALLWAALSGCAGALHKEEAAEEPVAARYGIEVVGVRLTAGGYFLDFRYRVVDPEKAAPLLDRRVKPYVQLAGGDLRLFVPVAPTVGTLRQTTQKVRKNHEYFALFGNPGRRVTTRDRVDVVFGEIRLTNLQVM